MKKVLLTSTALVMVAGMAAADGHAGVSVGGSAKIWIEDVGGAPDPVVGTDIEISFAGAGETDGGTGFGFDYTIENLGTKDNWEAYVSFGAVELRTGDPDSALQNVAGMGDIGFDGLGVDDAAEQARGATTSGGVLITYSAGDFSAFLSHNANLGDDDVGVGVKGTFGDITVGLGYEDTLAAGGVTALDVAAGLGDASVALYYEDSDLGSGYGIEVGYDIGDIGLSLAYADHDAAADAAMGVGFSYGLGGGATISGGVADDGANTNWDFGIGMSF